jgi:hypothetical protein
MLASMKMMMVEYQGFYDDVIPLGPSEKLALNVPSVDNQMKTELGMGAPEMKGVSLNEDQLTIIEHKWHAKGNVGKMASNQIPTTANAVLDLRLVLGNDWKSNNKSY